MSNSQTPEQARIQAVYADRDRKVGSRRFSKPEDLYISAVKQRLFASALSQTIGEDLGDLRILDVGCGRGDFLRQLAEWGAAPAHLVGTEFLTDRLEAARKISHPDMTWHLGGLEDLPPGQFDLIAAHTVLTSVLDPNMRAALCNQIWQRLAPGGWAMVFDFRFNNPRNPDVKRVTRAELDTYWPDAHQVHFQKALLAPPLLRRLVGRNFGLVETVTATLPFLQSHFAYLARKPLQ
jgi:SAM-dependent methyltransferase